MFLLPLRTRGCGALGARHPPTPSDVSEGRNSKQTSRDSCGEIAKLWPKFLSLFEK
jgi:hypothetical protein